MWWEALDGVRKKGLGLGEASAPSPRMGGGWVCFLEEAKKLWGAEF